MKRKSNLHRFLSFFWMCGLLTFGRIEGDTYLRWCLWVSARDGVPYR
jgi:hypothetical protein